MAFFGGTPWRAAVRAMVAKVLGYLAYMIFLFITGVIVGVAVVLSERAAG